MTEAVEPAHREKSSIYLFRYNNMSFPGDGEGAADGVDEGCGEVEEGMLPGGLMQLYENIILVSGGVARQLFMAHIEFLHLDILKDVHFATSRPTPSPVIPG